MPVQTEQIKDTSVVPIFYLPLWYVLVYFGAISLLSLLVLWWDRHQAKKKGKRVAELWMMVLGLLGGAAAMWCYMRVTHHKIRYKKFSKGFPLMALAHGAIFALLAIYDRPHKAIEIDLVYIIAAYVVMNLLGIYLTRMDKRNAQRDIWRISEAVLMLVGALGGALGMFLAMLLIRHKTRYVKFMLGLPLMVVAQLALFWFLTTDYCKVIFIWFP